MAPYQQQPPVVQNWDRWQHQHAGSDYTMTDYMTTSYDPRTVPTTSALQRPSMAPQYSIPTPYADSPVTPMSASPYGSQGHFGDYQPYAYQTPSTSSSFTQIPSRSASRPMAPPTPPLDDDRGMRLSDGRAPNTVKSTYRRSPRRSVSVVKSETSKEPKEIKTCPVLVKDDGSLQYESKKLVDRVLRGAAAKLAMRTKSNASTPESMASPPSEEDSVASKPVKKHACNICPARFLQLAQLATHQRSHTGEKPYTCLICGRGVSQPGNMKAHMRRHTHEKLWKCDICNHPFSSNGGLKVHIRNKHDGEPKKPCPMKGCVKEFSTIGNMKVHIDKFHTEKLNYYLQMVEETEDPETLPKDVRGILERLLTIYKNSNRGIKGRGPDQKEDKDASKQLAAKREPAHQEMTPVSPDAANAVHEYRQYYDQQQQQHYQVLPHPAQQATQQSPGYLQLPMHQPQHQVYHGLPQPGAYNMGWTPGPQYH